MRRNARSLAQTILQCTVLWLASVASSHGQIEKILQEAGVVASILDEKVPFDIIVVKKDAGGGVVKVNPIEDFPDRTIPTSPKETDRIRVTFPVFPDRKYEIMWKEVEAIYLYEQLILLVANRLLENKQFGEAFEHLNFLTENFPQTPGLPKIRRDFMYRSAIEMANARRLPHALAVLEQFQREFPNDKDRDRVRNAISNVSSQLIEAYFDSDDLATAKSMLQRLDNDYKKDPLPVVEKWRGKFQDLAKEYQAKSIAARDSGELVTARQLATKMLDVDPQIEGGKQYLTDLIRSYPVVRVGVFQRTLEPDTSALADWPAFRVGQLVTRPLFEFKSTGPEGGLYRFSFGSFQHSDDRAELDLMIQNPGRDNVPDSLAISKVLLDRASVDHPDYSPSWASIVESAAVTGPERLKLRLRKPHVLPQAFLQWQLPIGGNAEKSLATYSMTSSDAFATRYSWSDAKQPTELQPREIHEVLYADPETAIRDLLRGDIEMIDRVFPADAFRLRSAKNIVTEEYALPVVHMLIPRSKNPYLDVAEFRRALLYAIDRERILNGEILGGQPSKLSRVISGPFPQGASDADPIAYAYNTSVENVSYDPRAAKILILLAQAKLRAIAEKRSEEVPPIPVLKLGVPGFETARVAGEAIVQAWKLIGVPSELVVLDKLPRPREESPVDLIYISASIWEPATDAERLLGQGGAAETNNQFIIQELVNLNAARNWHEVRRGCQDLHALVAAHLPILPLWQVTETFAYRTDVVGVAKKPIGLYQDVQKWRYQIK
jgi:tetratricopeptide (TPR) repeat protein